MGDFDRTYRNEVRGVAPAADYDRGYRNEFRAFGTGDGDRKLEIVKGNVYSASQSYSSYSSSGRDPASSMRRPSPDPPFPPPRRERSSGASVWCFGDPEMKRRRRVMKYKKYAVEGKLKASLRKGFRWIKVKCSELVHGW
ncbi:hypothetical protein Cni_G19050 [Canna indica]|uniref:DUF3511 domain protein n=1 Tax=Canna indica TaxID=4628 RepID=A0AAQ3KLT1_9LILI|nr:hypothetical protein Cni_G19050 [Canna indica]